MASFCAKCGAEISPDKQFCSACGAPAAVGGAVYAPVQPVAAPAQSGSGAVKIVLIVVAVIVENGGYGAAVAAPIVRDVLRVALARTRT